MTVPVLNRKDYGRPAAPVRIVHIGLGNFTRAHQAWYTEHASDAKDWGIAAFTGRRPTMAELLTPQDGLYTLITKGTDGDSYEVISSVSEIHPASEFDKLIGFFANPNVVIVTSTVTEAGYCRAADGSLDKASQAVAADLEVAKKAFADGVPSVEQIGKLEVSTAPVKVMLGIAARMVADAGKLTVLPCDNIPNNGEGFNRVVRDAAEAVSSEVVAWLDANTTWATCMVDRITPATTDEEIAEVEAEQGYKDASPVPTEPFREWVISGEFPGGCPDWESAGAQIVDAVEPYEERKLWMLNGSHTLMAYVGPLKGCETVADAITHPEVRPLVLEWWKEAGSGLSIDWEDYTKQLIERFENPNIRHLLSQIAADGSQKIPVRIVPTIRRYRKAGEMPEAAVAVVAAWVLHLRGASTPVKDAAAESLKGLVGGSLEDDAVQVLKYLGEDLAADQVLVDAVVAQAKALS